VSVQFTPRPAPGQGGADRSPRTVQPFAAIPHDLVADGHLKPIDVKLVAILLRYARSKATCWPSVATLATDLGRCERTVQYALRRLTEAGWITSRPDANPTGRLLVLVWREAKLHPPVQPPYSQGMPRVKPVAPEPEKRNQREGSAPARTESQAPEPPMTHAELQDLLALDLPASSPLRHIVEQKLAKALERHPGTTMTSPAKGLTIGVRNWRSVPQPGHDEHG